MVNPNMPNMASMPGMEAMTDSLEFVKNLWGSMGLPGTAAQGMNIPGMNIPGMVMPTLSVDEIQKRITDLRAVESWLSLNMTMLRSSIQALEVQAATLNTLQSMSESFAATMNAGSTAFQEKAEPAKAAGGNGAAAPDGGTGTDGAGKLHGAPEPTSKDETDAASLTAPLVNAAAWWNLLQDQFKQAVNTAMTETAVATKPDQEKPKARAKPKAKPASSSSSSSTTRKRKTTK